MLSVRKAQVHVKFSNSDNHELPHHQRSSKSNQESSSEEIVNQRNIVMEEIVSLDKEEEVERFQDKYEHVGTDKSKITRKQSKASKPQSKSVKDGQ
ncbi:hypothetical protein Tco_1498903 [Tanacetum coccineum]